MPKLGEDGTAAPPQLDYMSAFGLLTTCTCAWANHTACCIPQTTGNSAVGISRKQLLDEFSFLQGVRPKILSRVPGAEPLRLERKLQEIGVTLV